MSTIQASQPLNHWVEDQTEVMQPRRHHESQATKASRALAAEQRADNELALTAKFNKIFLQHEEDIKTLTRDFSKTENYIRQVLENRTHYTGKRALSLKNAITHRLSKEARENGDTYNARDEEINLSGEWYQAYKDSLTEEEKKSLLDDLAESKNVKEHGVRVTNKAVALDAMQTTSQIGKVIIALHSRTAEHLQEHQDITFSGVGFAMFTRGHPDDPAMPSFVESDEASKFFEDTFDCSIWDVVRKFELWSCNRDKVNNRNNIDAVRNQITVLVEEALRKITGNKTLTMSWANYKIDIVHTHGVEMAGWPSSVVLVWPSKMAADAARRVLDKLRSGAIHWVALTRSQRAEVVEEVEALRESGAMKKRKQRSDKDKPRGLHAKKSKVTDPNASEDDSEEEPMPVSASRAPIVPTSAPRAPNTPASAPGTPNTRNVCSLCAQCPRVRSRVPNAPASAPQAPNAPVPASQALNAPASASQAPNAPASAPQVLNAPASAACVPITEVSAAAGKPQTSQPATSAALHSASPATSLSHAATAFTGTLPASSATPAAFSPASPAGFLSMAATAITSTSTTSSTTSAALSAGLSPATCLSSAGTMPFGSQLADEHFNFDFVGMDFGPMPLFPSSTSMSQLGLSTDELTNNGVTMCINTLNREDFVFDGGFNGGSGVAGDPSPLICLQPGGQRALSTGRRNDGVHRRHRQHVPRGVYSRRFKRRSNCFRSRSIHVGLLCGHQHIDAKTEEGRGGWGREASTQDAPQEELGQHRGRRHRHRHASPFEACPESSAAALTELCTLSAAPVILTRYCQSVPMPYIHLKLL
ncbi:hypothetical protein B0H14DRAFT_3519191 [Mycena olivaceomarginata]|nr:hypothetical protein B0H14DRAFT_3519191 [Mycena olivaceomarginata]